MLFLSFGGEVSRMVEGLLPFMAVCLQVQTKLAQQPQSLGSVTERPPALKSRRPTTPGLLVGTTTTTD
jgi:hypothetical protein